MRVVALIKGAKLADIEPSKPATKKGVAKARAELQKRVASALVSDLSTEKVQNALARIRGEGRSLQTCNHHRNAIKSFVKWLYETHRIRENILRGVAGYNVKEDPRHERRTVCLEELRKLIEVSEAGEPFKSMTGPMRSLCYRLAVASGLRYAEIGSIVPESFDWNSQAPPPLRSAPATRRTARPRRCPFRTTWQPTWPPTWPKAARRTDLPPAP